jgi:carbamoylphosphate synthase small subunit
MSSYDPNESLDVRRSHDGKEVISLEEFLYRHVRRPNNAEETLNISATELMKVLGVPGIGRVETKRIANWLRNNGYTQIKAGFNFKIALINKPTTPYRLV